MAKQENETNVLLPVLLVGAVGLASFGAYKYMNRDKNPFLDKEEEKDGGNTETTKDTTTTTAAAFPLKFGMRGNQLVQDIQNALLAKGGTAAAEIKASNGADGNFGSGTERALKAAGYPVVVDNATYTRILMESRVQPSNNLASGATVAEVVQMVQYFKNGTISSGSEALKILAKIKNVSDYTRVSEEVKKASWSGGKSLLAVIFGVSWPYNSAVKKQIEDRFIVIGLKKGSNGVWSLGGLGEISGMLAMTVAPTNAYNADGTYMELPSRVIAGEYLRGRNGWAYILSSGRVYAAPSENIVRVPK